MAAVGNEMFVGYRNNIGRHPYSAVFNAAHVNRLHGNILSFWLADQGLAYLVNFHLSSFYLTLGNIKGNSSPLTCDFKLR